MEKRIVIFDFDHTIFDTEKFFENDLPDFIGIDRKIFKKAYEKNFKVKKTKKVNYDLIKHLEILGVNNTETRKKIFRFLTNIRKYLMPGSIEFLEKIKKNGDELYLVTFGNIAWQKLKVNNIKKLKRYFNPKHRIFVDKNKIGALDFIKNKNKDKEVILINDNKKESLAMKKFFGRKTKLFLISGVYSKNYRGKVYKDLLEINKELFK
jgi:hypothetical protein